MSRGALLSSSVSGSARVPAPVRHIPAASSNSPAVAVVARARRRRRGASGEGCGVIPPRMAVGVVKCSGCIDSPHVHVVDAVGVVRRLRLHAADDGELVGICRPSSAGTRTPGCRCTLRLRSAGTARRSAGRASCRRCRSGWPRRSSTAGCSACRSSCGLGGDRSASGPGRPSWAGRSPPAGDQRALEEGAAAEVLAGGHADSWQASSDSGERGSVPCSCPAEPRLPVVNG